MGDGLVVVRLHGLGARELLARGCTLDLHPRAFPPWRCAQTLCAKADVIIQAVDAGDDEAAFDLIVRRSFADYLWRWLADASSAL